MEITWAGLLVFPITLYIIFSLSRLSKTLVITVFFLPFGSIAVFNVFSFSPSFGIGLDRFFSVFLIVAVMYSIVFSKASLERIPYRLKLGFCLFFLTILISYYTPIFSDGIFICYHIAGNFVDEPLEFSSRNISRIIEFLISGLFFISIYKSMPFVYPKKFAKALLLSLGVMSLSGFLDLLPNMNSVWVLMKNNISHPNVVGLISGKVGEMRLSGLSVEPSHFLIYTSCGFFIMCSFFKNGISYINKFVDLALLLFFAFSALMSFSPTILIVFPLAGLYFIYNKKLFSSTKFILAMLVIIVLALVFSNNILETFDILFGNAMGKLGFDNQYAIYSDFRRFSHFAAFDAFKQSPIIGVGWGSILLPVGVPILLLGSVGVIGTLACVYLIFSVFALAINKLRASCDLTEKTLREGLILCFVFITTMCIYTKGWQYFLSLPLVFFGASMCSSFKKCHTQENNNKVK